MAELLQTHRPRVALSTFRTQGLLPTHSLAYKNVPRTHGYRTFPPDVSTAANMEDQAQDQIERILDRIHSLDELSADNIIELRRISERSLVIDKFKVSPANYWNWLDKVGNDIRGVEYDAQNARIVLKECPKWMHEAATGVIYTRLFGELEDRLSAATGSSYSLTGGTDCLLTGDFKGSVKQADASLMNFRAKWPVVVLEVGISETTSKLYQDAERWLEGSNHETKLVILVDVQETPRWKTSNDNWGLSEIDFQQTNHDRLSDHIFQWYRSKGIRLHGSFKLSVHLWYSDDDRQCILNKAVFSAGNLIDLETISDVSLRLEHLMPAGSDLDVNQPISFPLRRLVDKLQNGLENIEIQRAIDLADNKLKKFPS